jgi:hypothetical protein
MRRILSVLLLTAMVVSVHAQNKANKDLARVRKVNGVEAYILCEPLRPYEVVVDAGTGIKAESLLTAGLINKTISGRVEQFVRNVSKQNPKIDAVVYAAGKRIAGIIFTDKGSASTRGVGRVSKVLGFPVYVMNEPIQDYQVISSKSGGIKWKSLITAGVINNSIEEDVEQMVKKVQSRAADGILIDGGRDASAIMFR